MVIKHKLQQYFSQQILAFLLNTVRYVYILLKNYDIVLPILFEPKMLSIKNTFISVREYYAIVNLGGPHCD